MRRTIAALALTIAAVFTACSSSTPHLSDPTATGRQLATEFLSILQSKDAKALDHFLADGFQLQRADGSGATREEYLAKPAKVDKFELGEKVTAIQDGNLLTVRWSVKVSESTNGQQLGTAEAPRLSVFVYTGGHWKMLAHANFNRPN